MTRNPRQPEASSGNGRLARARRILVVDDDDDLRDSLSAALKDEGWEVVTAKSGQEAVALAPDLDEFVLLVDYRMPGLSGGKVFEHLRARLDAKLEGVLMTASANVTDLARQHGFRHHVGKPFSLDDLLETLERARGGNGDATEARKA